MRRRTGLRLSKRNLINTLQVAIIIIIMDRDFQIYRQGSATGWMIVAIAGITLFLVALASGIWVYTLYSEQKTDVNGKIDLAVAAAVKKQSEEDEIKFQESFKNPRVEFVGPFEYGRVSFMYPKTWSVYVDKDGSDRGNYEAYLHPVSVPPTTKKESRYAMRLEILNKNLDDVVKQYEAKLKKGELKSSSVEFNSYTATRIDGLFEKELRGSVVLMRARDKTIRFSTDADLFKPDFEAVLNTLEYIE